MEKNMVDQPFLGTSGSGEPVANALRGLIEALAPVSRAVEINEHCIGDLCDVIAASAVNAENIDLACRRLVDALYQYRKLLP